MSRSASQQHVVTLRPKSGFLSLGLVDIWQYRDLIYILCWRDVTVRYKQTVLGLFWAILVPFATMVVFSLLFGRLANFPSDGFPYPIFVFAGLLPWQLFARSLSGVGSSLTTNESLIRKVYFPRLALPLASMLPALVDFVLGLIVLVGLMMYFGVKPGWNVVAAPLFVGYALIVALSVGLWLAVLNVAYRDVGHVLPFIVQLWFFATPVVYPVSVIDEGWRLPFALNPMTGVIQGFRWSFLNGAAPNMLEFSLSGVVTVVLLVAGLYLFRAYEGKIVDRL